MIDLQDLHILVIDDDPSLSKLLKDLLAHRVSSLAMAQSIQEAKEVANTYPYDVVLLDQKLPDGKGEELAEYLREKAGKMIYIIVMTAYPSVENACKLLSQGVYDYLIKPFDASYLFFLLQKASFFLSKVFNWKERDEYWNPSLLSIPMETFQEACKAFQHGIPILIRGETGTGKSWIARQIHRQVLGKDLPYVEINSTTIQENLAEAELFGYEKGAFTGAIRAKPGLFAMAGKGTIFFDEIGDMPFWLQGKVLQALEEKCFRPLGSSKTLHMNFRIITATHRPLERWVREGKFRQDLWYRLCGYPLTIPPLRKRKEDIPTLCYALLSHLYPQKKYSIPEEEMQKLCAYPWYGNIRELLMILKRAVALSEGPLLFPSRFLSVPPLTSCEKPRTLAEVEKETILKTLEACGGNKTQTAKFLGISLSTLKRKLRSF